MRAEYLMDVSRLIWRASTGRLPTGIDRVCLAYIEHFRHRAQAVVQWKGKRKILPWAVSQRLFDIILSSPTYFRQNLALLVIRSLPHFFCPEGGDGRIYLNVGHSGLDQAGLLDWVDTINIRPVFMLHDLIPITHPQYCRPGSAEKHEKRIAVMLASGAGIICNSEVTLNIITDYAMAHTLPFPPMISAWLGATSLSFSKSSVLEIEYPYFITLGTIEGRKNHILLLHIWSNLVAKYTTKSPRLLIVGQRGWENEEVLSLLDTGDALRPYVIEIPRCTDADLAQYLSGARALLFPSFAEGYGMPLVEALGHGTPVITSDLAVFHELAGNIPVYIDSNDMAGWQTAIIDYCRCDSSSRKSQLARMAQYKMPTWSEHFAKVEDWLETL